MAMVASVTISGGIRPKATRTPFTSPAKHPDAHAAHTANHMPNPHRSQHQPKITAHNPIIEPTDRSIPAVIIINVIGSAMSPISTKCRVISSRFWIERNRGDKAAMHTETPTNTAANTASLPIGRILFIQACSFSRRVLQVDCSLCCAKPLIKGFSRTG
jgi:hypothetical protein